MHLPSLGVSIAAALMLSVAAPALAQDDPAPPADAAAPAEAAPVEAAPVEAAPAAAPVAEVAAPTPIGTGAGGQHIMAPPPGKAQVVFFRRSAFVGAAIGGRVREAEVPIGNLTAGRYFLHVTDPGEHTYTVKTEVTENLTMELEAGETYFVEETVSMGVLVGRLNLSPSDIANFDAAYPKMKPAKPLKAD
jgi:hypothetical protein